MTDTAEKPITPVPRTSRLQWYRWKWIEPYLWFIPIAVIMGSILLYPWVSSFILSFQHWTPATPDPPRWAGLDNYIRLLTDRSFWGVLQRTAILVFTTVVAQFVIGFAIALLLNSINVGRGVLLTMYILPLMLTSAIIGLSWRMLLHQEWGVFNWVLTSIGLQPVGWLSDPSWTLPTIIMIEIWNYTPFGVLILLAGLQAIPQEQIEAAKVDGASSIQVFRYIILPFLAPLILIVLLFRIIFSLRTFDIIYALFQSGGPGNEGMVIGVFLYHSFRTTWQLGLASAIAFILLFLTVGLTALLIVRFYRGAFDD